METDARASALRYLEEKAQEPREWLRRDPRETHPAILAACREYIAARTTGTVYDEEVERYLHAEIGEGLAPYLRHGHEDRDPIVSQLGHEVYVARRVLDDEAATAEIMRALDDGYVPLAETEIEDGGRYLVRFGTLYSGHAVAKYGPAREVRAKLWGADGRLAFMPKGARTRGYDPSMASAVLVKVAP